MADITIANVFYSGDGARSGYVPVGPLYVTAALEREGYDVEFRDYQLVAGDYADPMDPRTMEAFLGESAGVLGIGCASELLLPVLTAVNRIKRRFPQKNVVMGGIGSAGAAGDILRDFPSVDYVALGEGERSIVQLMEYLDGRAGRNRMPSGIAYRRSGVPVAAPPDAYVPELDSLPFPAYRRVEVGAYGHAGIYTARGCPYHCTFCDVAPFWGQACHSRSVENVVDEIQLLVERYQRTTFDIMDDIFVLDRTRALSFCREIRRRKLEIEWACCGRIDLMDEEMMAEMADSGCSWIFYGIESGAGNILKIIRKGFTNYRARGVVLLSRKYFSVVTSLMWGFPFESLEDFASTVRMVEFLRDNGCAVDLYLLAPLPLSALFREYAHNLEFAPETCRRVFGVRAPQMKRLILRYPGVSRWYYRYPTPHFEAKLDIVRRLEIDR